MKCRNSDKNFWMHQFHRGKQISEKVPSNRSTFRQRSTCRSQVSRETTQMVLAWRLPVDHLPWIAQPVGIFVSSAQNATKLQLQPYNASGSPTPWCRVQNKTKFCELVPGGICWRKYIYTHYVAWEYNRYWSAQNHIIIHGVSWCDFKVSMWCVVSATRITGSTFLRS